MIFETDATLLTTPVLILLACSLGAGLLAVLVGWFADFEEVAIGGVVIMIATVFAGTFLLGTENGLRKAEIGTLIEEEISQQEGVTDVRVAANLDEMKDGVTFGSLRYSLDGEIFVNELYIVAAAPSEGNALAVEVYNASPTANGKLQPLDLALLRGEESSEEKK